MLRSFVVFSALNSLFVTSVFYTGPQYPPTHGEVWPKPQMQIKHDQFLVFDPANFTIKAVQVSCPLLTQAIKRYVYTIKSLKDLATKYKNNKMKSAQSDKQNFLGTIKQLQVKLTSPCEDYPHFGMDEIYYLNVSMTSNLRSASIWGILRGLETFSQLFFITDDFKEVRIHQTEILDYPRFSHRGLLIDTSRHFITVENIFKTIDALSMNKMNVLHWHIVDDQSFPYESQSFPELSGRGAYHSSMVYKRADVVAIINYARDRGVRVIPEFDVPGHTLSWGVAYPNILTECYNYKNEKIGLGPMNPIKNVTYKLIRTLFQEVQSVFKDKFFHVGGDEVNLSCWTSNPEIKEYMKDNDIKSALELHALFMRNTIPLLANNSIPIVWQEVFDEHVPLRNGTIVQVWKNEGRELVRAIKAGYQTLYSTDWYLDHVAKRFDDFYSKDPRQMVIDITKDPLLAERVVGGEACIWGELVDDRNFISRTWPRTSAVAERLWSAGLGQTKYKWRYFRIPEETYHRIEEHVCRMIRRGIPAEPSKGPGFCIA